MAAKLQAASELADELENISEEDRAKIKQSLGDIARDTPATSVAIIRLKKTVRKGERCRGANGWINGRMSDIESFRP